MIITEEERDIIKDTGNLKLYRINMDIISSDTIGMLVLAGAVLMRAPQLAILLRNGSAEGLSYVMFEIEFYCHMALYIYACAKRFPFLSYGETLIGTFTLACILSAMLAISYHEKKPGIDMGEMARVRFHFMGYEYVSPAAANRQILGVAMKTTRLAFVVTVFAVVSRLGQMPMISALATTAVPLGAVCRVPQIQKCREARSMGTLSPTMIAAAFAGSLLRMYTTVVDMQADPLMLVSFGMGAVFNAVLLRQFWQYRAGAGQSLIMYHDAGNDSL
jgi:mannose-P-dolichol utilization defect protein 1